MSTLGDELAYAYEQYEKAAARHEARERGRTDLAFWAETALTDRKLWSIQAEIARALSTPRAVVAVPSCYSSGKTWLAPLMALGFYDCFPDSKVVTFSSSFEHLRDELWGELRGHLPHLAWPIEGRVLPGALRIDGGPNHYIVGRAPDSQESTQGYHAPHILIVVDEATSVDQTLADGLRGLRASGDCRILAIFNPTDDTSWAYDLCQLPSTDVIRISAVKTPNFTKEPLPPTASLIDEAYLQDLIAAGQGPGTYVWTTKVEAQFWTIGEDKLISTSWVNAAPGNRLRAGPRVMAIDLASYGDNENTIAYREGNRLTKLEGFPSMRSDIFWKTIVKPRVLAFDPAHVVYDGDGPGAGAYESAVNACGEHRLLVVRGGVDVGVQYVNLRSMWWWRLRGLFERGELAFGPEVVDDHLMKSQLGALKYGFPNGKIAVETKEQARRRGVKSLDRADVVMYAFSFDAPDWSVRDKLPDFSEKGLWKRVGAELDRQDLRVRVHPVTGIPDADHDDGFYPGLEED
jgi:hypothetical protein